MKKKEKINVEANIHSGSHASREYMNEKLCAVRIEVLHFFCVCVRCSHTTVVVEKGVCASNLFRIEVCGGASMRLKLDGRRGVVVTDNFIVLSEFDIFIIAFKYIGFNFIRNKLMQ